MSPLFDATHPLLRVAPDGIYLFDREYPREVMVFRPRYGIWLSVYNVPSAQRREEYRVIEWGQGSLHDLLGVHFFPSRWELMTRIEERFSMANP